MESKIIWKSGSPNRYGRYLIVREDGCIDIDDWSAYGWEYYGDKVIYWCDMNNIKLTKK